ncbi:MAG: ATP-binding cassette domain-containing protein, partial [Pseudomonas sp.]|nr:ATP-binding cassette domain-containing protein [Pseudomonas sp.]
MPSGQMDTCSKNARYPCRPPCLPPQWKRQQPVGNSGRMRRLFLEMPMTLLKFADVSLAYGAMPLLDGVSWQIARGERVCIIGRNGTGKSSMLKLVKGDQMLDD